MSVLCLVQKGIIQTVSDEELGSPGLLAQSTVNKQTLAYAVQLLAAHRRQGPTHIMCSHHVSVMQCDAAREWVSQSLYQPHANLLHHTQSTNAPEGK